MRRRSSGSGHDTIGQKDLRRLRAPNRLIAAQNRDAHKPLANTEGGVHSTLDRVPLKPQRVDNDMRMSAGANNNNLPRLLGYGPIAQCVAIAATRGTARSNT